MTLDELRNLVLASGPYDWNRILPIGATYLNRFGTVGHPGRESHLEHSEHTNRASYLHDVNLGLAWGMDVDADDDGDRVALPWRDRFPDKKVSRAFVELFWAGMLVDRELIYYADGGRVVLPND